MKNLEITPELLVSFAGSASEDGAFIFYQYQFANMFEYWLKQNSFDYAYSEWTENLDKGLFAYQYKLTDADLGRALYEIWGG